MSPLLRRMSTWRPERPPRAVLGAAYTLFAAAGAAAIIWPSPSVSTAAGATLAAVWAGFLTAGGTLGALGQLTDRWLGELLGLPLLMTAFTIFAGLAFLQAASPGRTPTAGFFLLALVFLLHARWIRVWGIRRLAINARNAKGTVRSAEV